MRATAKATLIAKAGMTASDAETIVTERWAKYVAPIETPDPLPDTVMAEQFTSAAPPTRGEIKSRLDDYVRRRNNLEVSAAATTAPVDDSPIDHPTGLS